MEPIFLRINDVTKLTSISRSSIYRMINEGDFPVQISVGNRQVRWSRQEVIDWCEGKLLTTR
jgi:prophage regulatory protein